LKFPITRGIVAASLLVTLGGCGYSPEKVRADVKPEDKRKPAPDFTLKDATGKPVKLSEYKGKVVLLNFWATWCGPCKLEIPWFIDFEKQYKDQGFSVLGVAMDDEGWQVVRPYIEEKKVNYRVLMGDDMTAQQYGGVDSLPTTYIIDREGRIASIHVGLVSKSDYQNEISELLKTPAARRGASSGGPAVELARANQRRPDR
jgi:cytochrome c biogenesis protein CcmG/thiol:disulfide interchange protein DsbE